MSRPTLYVPGHGYGLDELSVDDLKNFLADIGDRKGRLRQADTSDHRSTVWEFYTEEELESQRRQRIEDLEQELAQARKR